MKSMLSSPSHIKWCKIFGLMLILALGGCQKSIEKHPRLSGPIALASLPGWMEEDLRDYAVALRHSCKANATAELRLPHAPHIPMSPDAHQKLCDVATADHFVFKNALEDHFDAYLVLDGHGRTHGLFTGYFEPEMKGSKHPSPHYSIPVYAKPQELTFKNNPTPAGNTKMKFWTRDQIVAGAIHPKPTVLAWVHDPIDLFFLHIQGSGIITFSDGRKQRVGYDGTNGHAYYAIGLELLKRGELSKENISMQSIKAWLRSHPDQADTIMNLNPSYVFLRFVNNPYGPIGSQGVPLTPLRSLAVDRKYYPMGLPVWLETIDPNGKPIRQLMVTQDTGGAIKGVIRGDVFWGHGNIAYDYAGRMKSQGQLYVILPKSISNSKM
jgi:membrane-bound lytic murein transglycosylase A